MTKPVTRKMAVDCLLDRVIRQFGAPLLCACGCGTPLMPGDQVQFDHHHADGLGGPHEYQNLRPIQYDPCHKKKSKRDVAAMAKIDRITGVTKGRPVTVWPKGQKIPSRPFPKRIPK